MARRKILFLFTAEDIEGNTAQNAHVFCGTYDTDTDSCCYAGSVSKCGKVIAKEDAFPFLTNANVQQFCRDVIEGHGTDFKVCGACMATFFALSDQDQPPAKSRKISHRFRVG